MKSAAVVVVALAVSACAFSDLFAPVGYRGVAGVYLLRAYDGAAVPSRVFDDGEQIAAGYIRLSADSSYTDVVVIRTAAGDVRDSIAGRWSLVPDSVLFTSTAGVRYAASCRGDVLALVWADAHGRAHTFTYRR